jgi:flavin reductase (DIM6/NTAB) family NADH-FMN oxidoreductase RutF
MLGFCARSKTPINLRRTGECVLNLPSVDQVGAVDRLARLTGSDPVSPHKVAMGYRHERDVERRGALIALEVRIVRVHLDDSILMPGDANRVDPVAWRPLVMSFCQLFGLGPMVHSSRLAEIPESAYRPQRRPATSAPHERRVGVAGRY